MSEINHPWEENRGMGVSFGLNRAEQLDGYHTGQELIIMLADTVSRGGNLLLDIGPAADGTIPLLMEERLGQIGNWLKINGEAIYGTKSWKSTRQWSVGEIPQPNYNGEYDSAYDVSKLALKPEPGQASVEALFTTKGNDLYAILPRWPGSSFELKDTAGVKAVTLLGDATPLKFKSSNHGIVVSLHELPENLRQQTGWVLKVSL